MDGGRNRIDLFFLTLHRKSLINLSFVSHIALRSMSNEPGIQSKNSQVNTNILTVPPGP